MSRRYKLQSSFQLLLFHFVEPIRYYISVARLGLAKTSQSLALQRQYPPPEFGVFFNPLHKIVLELLDSIFPADSVSHTEWVAEVSIFSSTGTANVNIVLFLVDGHDHCLHRCFPFLLLSGGQSRGCRNLCLLIPFIGISMFPFYGVKKFSIRLARRRAHPCDEQIVPITCSFSLFFHVKAFVSILWVGLAEQGVCRGSTSGSSG